MLVTHHLGNLIGNLLLRKRSVNLFHVIHHLLLQQTLLRLTLPVHLVDQPLHTPLLQQLDRRVKRDKLVHPRHIDPVTIGITNLRGGRHHHDTLRTKTIENTQNTLLQRRPPHDRIINHHEIIRRLHHPVSHVIHVSHQPVAPRIRGNKRPQLRILDHDLLDTGFPANNLVQRLLAPRRLPLPDQPLLLLHHIQLNPFHHPVKRSLRRVRDKRKHRVIQIPLHGLHQTRGQQLAQLLPFLIYTPIIPP